MGVAAVRNCRCRSRNVRTGSLVHRCSPFRVEAHRSSTSQNELSLSLRLPIYHQISCLRRGLLFAPQESAICPDVGLLANGTWADNGSCLEQRCEGSGGAYVE